VNVLKVMEKIRMRREIPPIRCLFVKQANEIANDKEFLSGCFDFRKLEGELMGCNRSCSRKKKVMERVQIGKASRGSQTLIFLLKISYFSKLERCGVVLDCIRIAERRK